MAQFALRSAMSWDNFVLGRQISSDIGSAISSQTASIIAGQNRQVDALANMATGISTGLADMQTSLVGMSSKIADLDGTFRWGISELAERLGGLNDSLQELIKIAKTPSQTWAYEQFEIAREACRRELFEEALLHLDRAINGFESQPGYSLEHRFHMMAATIRLGGRRITDPKIINLLEAEKFFLEAARLSRVDDPDQSARAMCGASWAAYCQGRISDARAHVQKAAELRSSFVEPKYLQAKYFLAESDVGSGVAKLEEAIRLDVNYATRMLDDPDFAAHENEIKELAIRVKDEFAAKNERLKNHINRLLSLCQSTSFSDGKTVVNLIHLENLNIARLSNHENTLVDHMISEPRLRWSKDEIATLANKFVQVNADKIQSSLNEADSALKNWVTPQFKPTKNYIPVSVLLGALFGLVACARVMSLPGRMNEFQLFQSLAFVWGPLLGLVVGVIINGNQVATQAATYRKSIEQFRNQTIENQKTLTLFKQQFESLTADANYSAQA